MNESWQLGGSQERAGPPVFESHTEGFELHPARGFRGDFFFWSGNDIISLIDFLGQLLWVWEEQILLEEGDREREGEREYLGTQNSCVIVSLKAYIFNRAPKSDKGLPT